MLHERIGFIGAGQMATALAAGLLDAGLCSPDRLLASDPSDTARQCFSEATKAAATPNNAQVAAQSDVLVLAVKPPKIPAVAAELRGQLRADRLLVSIAAGVSIESLAQRFGPELAIIRVMPNGPCLVRRGSSAYAVGPRATTAHAALVERLLGALGSARQVEEGLLDAVTALASSGPAFVYVMIETMSDAGVGLGLPRAVATEMAAEAVRGAAEMVLGVGQHPAVLKDRVASPAGTTIAGLCALESNGFRAALWSAIDAAARRANQLGGHVADQR